METDYTGHFCSSGCRECYREDKKQGLIYGAALVRDEVTGRESITGWYDACFVMGACAYCRAPIATQSTVTRRINRFFIQQVNR